MARTVFSIVATLLVLGVVTPTLGAAQGETAVFEGTLLQVDTQAQRLSVEASDGSQMAFDYTADTQIVGAADSIEGLAAASGTQVRVHYDANATAIRIEVLQQ